MYQSPECMLDILEPVELNISGDFAIVDEIPPEYLLISN